MTEPRQPPWSEADLDEVVTMRVRLSFRDVREINRRAGLNIWDGNARGAYVLGCALGESHDELSRRVHRIAVADRAQFRAELDLDHAKREWAARAASAPIAA